MFDVVHILAATGTPPALIGLHTARRALLDTPPSRAITLFVGHKPPADWPTPSRTAAPGSFKLGRTLDALEDPGVVLCWGTPALQESARMGVLEETPHVLIRLTSDEPHTPPSILGDWLGCREITPAVILDAWRSDEVDIARRSPARAESAPLRVALIGEGRHADALRAVFVCGLLRQAGCTIELLIPRHAASIDRARSFGREGDGPCFATLTTATQDEVIERADLAIFVAAGTGPTRMAEESPAAARSAAIACIEAGVPFVAPRWAVPQGLLLPAEAERCLAYDAALPELARILRTLINDPAVRRQVAESFRTPRSTGTGPTLSLALAAAIHKSLVIASA
jgi:hypothetical protein